MWTMFSLQLTVRCTCIADEADASRSLTETKGRHADEQRMQIDYCACGEYELRPLRG